MSLYIQFKLHIIITQLVNICWSYNDMYLIIFAVGRRCYAREHAGVCGRTGA